MMGKQNSQIKIVILDIDSMIPQDRYLIKRIEEDIYLFQMTIFSQNLNIIDFLKIEEIFN